MVEAGLLDQCIRLTDAPPDVIGPVGVTADGDEAASILTKALEDPQLGTEAPHAAKETGRIHLERFSLRCEVLYMTRSIWL